MKFRDGLIGLFVGDAFGVPYEFRKRGSFKASKDMVGGGSHGQPVGYWSDDSSMTLATIESINKKRKIDYKDIMDEFVLWALEGKHTPGGNTFDIGRITLKSIHDYKINGGNPLEAGATDIMANGNGSLMRILPIAYYCYSKGLSDEEIITIVSNISRLTHGHEISFIACFIYVKYIIYILEGKDLKESYKLIRELDYSSFDDENVKKFEQILKGDISKLLEEEIESYAYVLVTLEAVLWVILNTDSYENAIIKATELGQDTDTVAAIVGGIAGIYYGFDSIPIQWVDNLARLDELIVKFEDYVMTVDEIGK